MIDGAQLSSYNAPVFSYSRVLHFRHLKQICKTAYQTLIVVRVALVARPLRLTETRACTHVALLILARVEHVTGNAGARAGTVGAPGVVGAHYMHGKMGKSLNKYKTTNLPHFPSYMHV